MRGQAKSKGKGKGKGKDTDELVSKCLSSLLRHNAPERGIEIGEDGYCRIVDLLRSPPMRRLGATAEIIERVTRGGGKNEKERFQLSCNTNGEHIIRAVQGHSIPHVSDTALLRNGQSDLQDDAPIQLRFAQSVGPRRAEYPHGEWKIKAIKKNPWECFVPQLPRCVLLPLL
jgi:hypothetical protein